MTVPTNTLQTPNLVDIREDMVNFVYNVDPYRTPFLNMCKKTQAKQTYHEWNVDILAAQVSGNAAIQGDNPTNIALTPTGRMGNHPQISTKTIQLSGTVQAVVAAGETNTMGYQLAKKTKELKRDMEGDLTRNSASVAPASGTAGISAGLPTFITQNVVVSGTVSTGVVTIGGETFGNGTATYTTGSTAAITEANIKTVLAALLQELGRTVRVSPGLPGQQAEHLGLRRSRNSFHRGRGRAAAYQSRYLRDRLRRCEDDPGYLPVE